MPTPTCRSCGKRLPEILDRHMRTATPEELAAHRAAAAPFDAEREATRDSLDAGELTVGECNDRLDRIENRRASAVRRATPGVEVIPYAGVRYSAIDLVPTGRFGYGGHGAFCTLRCGYAYGLQVARNADAQRRRHGLEVTS